MQQGLYPVLARRDLTQALQRIAQRRGIDDGLLSRSESINVDAEDLLRFGGFGDLEPRLFLGISREHHQQPSIERRLALLGPEADVDFRAEFLPSLSSATAIDGHADSNDWNKARKTNARALWELKTA